MKIADRRDLRASLMFVIGVALLAGTGDAQTTRPGTTSDPFGEKERTSTNPVQIPQQRGPALESTISPQSYYVGPSDVFSVNIWSSPPVAFQLTVTPEGSLIVPTVGEIQVVDLTLAVAREKVLDAVKRKYLFATATMTLVVPRSLVVTVQGQVLNPGSYVMAAHNRVDKAVEEANRVGIGQLASERDANRVIMSTRRIIVKRKDGTQIRADLPKFLTTKEDRWNPYLREGDIIVVPTNDFGRNVIGVYGEVNAPGRFEFAEGDSVKDALRLAYGFAPTAHQDSVEFTRQDLKGAFSMSSVINGGGILDGRVRDFPLQPGDRLRVRGGMDYRGDYRVKVVGEVSYPGVYPITRNSTRLADVIRSAGGFTEYASLASAEVIRQAAASTDIATERLESLRGGVPPDDSTYFYLETNLRIKKEVVNANFVALFGQNDSSQNVPLQDEDVIIVPSRKLTVYVFGQVVNPGHVPFVTGQDVWYYIRKAGGATDRARRGDIKVVKAKTRQWLSPDDTPIEEGDYVWVPKNPERPFGYYLGIIAQSATIISVGVSIVLLVIQSNK